jgi:hypothetical protein
MAVRLITELALRIHLTVLAWLSAKMGAVVMARPVWEVPSGTAALATVGVGVLEIIVVLDVRVLLGAALQSAKMAPVATERLAKEVRLAIAALGMAGVGVPQITAALGVRQLLAAADGWNVAELAGRKIC